MFFTKISFESIHRNKIFGSDIEEINKLLPRGLSQSMHMSKPVSNKVLYPMVILQMFAPYSTRAGSSAVFVDEDGCRLEKWCGGSSWMHYDTLFKYELAP